MGEFGTNQKIAVGTVGGTILMTAAFLFIGKIDGSQWLTFCNGFVLLGLAATLGASAAIKVTQAIKGTPQESQTTVPPVPPTP